MTSNNATVARVQAAVLAVSSGKEVNEDAWVSMWCNANWGSLLQPAPLSIALLGSIMVLASSTDDFALTVEPEPGMAGEKIKFKYAKYPDSFKTCLQQMVSEGYMTWATVEAKMNIIKEVSSTIPRQIAVAVNLATDGTPEEVEQQLPAIIASVLAAAEMCKNAAEDAENAFANVAGLAQEMVLACTNKTGSTEQKLNQNRVHLEILKLQQDGGQKMLDQRKCTLKLMKESYSNAESDFKGAVENLPAGMELLGMAVVDGIVSGVAAIGNAMLSPVTMASRLARTGLEQYKTQHEQVPDAPVQTPAPSEDVSLPDPEAATDPAVSLVGHTLALATGLQLLIQGGEEEKPDWVAIRTKDSKSKNSAFYIRYSLRAQKKKLDTSRRVSKQLERYMNTLSKIIKRVIEVSLSVGAEDRSFDQEKPKLKEAIEGLQQLKQQCDLILQQSGQNPKGPATPIPPPSTSGSAAKIAVENAKFQVATTRSNLASARQAYDDAADRLVRGQQVMTSTIAEITHVASKGATLAEMLPILKKAVASFTLLRAQFSTLSEFFVDVASLLRDVMAPSVDTWSRALTNTTDLVAGRSWSDVTRHLIYSQMMVPLKVSVLAMKIATTYLEVSDGYIMPAQRMVGKMLDFNTDKTPEGKAKFQQRLQAAQIQIKNQSDATSHAITNLVAADQRHFRDIIARRLAAIENAVKPAIPTIAGPLPDTVRDIAEVYKKEHEAYNQQYDMNDYF